MACFDTCALLDSLNRGGRSVAEAVMRVMRERLQAGERLTTTRFNAAELWVGLERIQYAARERSDIEGLLGGLVILEFDESAARTFARVKAHRYRIGRPVADMDLLIASVAISNRECVVTRNQKHFVDIPELKVITY